MSRRRAFTLFDLIVVAAGGAIGIGVLLPYVGKIRQNASRTQSQNNLKQIGLGCHAYHDVNGVLPAGVDEQGFSTSARLLPYIEQNNVFQLINFTKDVDAKENANARGTSIKVFLDPGDPIRSVTTDWGATNYLFSAGSKADLADNDGVFYRDSKVKIVEITDGTSLTLLCGETLKGDSGMKAMDVHRQHIQYKKDALGQLADNSGVRDFQDDKNIAGDRCASWMDGRFLQGTYTATRTLNDSKPDVNCGGVGGLSGLRSLTDGVNVALCDGSVRHVNKKMSIETWKALATRNGGEVIPDF
jgi:hypothetical protein